MLDADTVSSCMLQNVKFLFVHNLFMILVHFTLWLCIGGFGFSVFCRSVGCF